MKSKRQRKPSPEPEPVTTVNPPIESTADQPPIAAGKRSIQVAIALGLVAWALLWGFQDITAAPALQFNLGPARWILIAGTVALAALPAASRWIGALIATVESQSPAARAKTALAISAVAAAYLMLTAHLQGRDLFAKTHDDQSYLLQIQMLARFRLWMPQHPLADFFDTFYVITRPVYASLYFPGAALLYVPTAWLGLPTWFLPALVAGACVGLTCLIVAEVVDGFSGVLAAAALVSLEYFRVFSVLLTSHEPMLLMGLLTTFAWLRWRAAGRSTRRRNAWALAIGIFAGWGAITRPADALCFALPIGVAMLAATLPFRGRSQIAASVRSGLLSFGLIVLGAAPFLALQTVFNKGVTGNWLETPYTFYLRHDQPNTSFGFHDYDPAIRPVSTNPKKQDYYDQFFSRYILRHQPVENLRWWGRVYFPMTVDTTLPARLLLPLAFAGVAGIAGAMWIGRRRALQSQVAPNTAGTIVAVIPLFLIVYYLNTFFLEHYAIIIAPAMLLLVVVGIRVVSTSWPGQATRIRSALSAGLLTASLLILPEFNVFFPTHKTGDETVTSTFMQMAKEQLPKASDLKKPTILLFTYRFGDPLTDEPVYNSDVTWPDDAEVICAHDLGPRNTELYRYYAERQPERYVYRVDRSRGTVDDLGKVRDLTIHDEDRK